MAKRVLFTGCLLAVVLAVSHVSADVRLTLGVVPQYDLAKIQAIWNPVLQQLREVYGITFVLRHSKSIPDFEQALYRGKYDCAYMNPYHLLVANRKSGYVPVVRDSAKKLYGIVVVAHNSRIKTVHELDRTVMAFPAPNALGATMLVRAELAERYGLELIPKYVKSHTSVYLNVILGRAKAGGGVMKTFQQQANRIKKRLRIIYKTRKVSAHPLACKSSLGERMLDRIQAAFIGMSSQKTKQYRLENFPMKKVGPANLGDYAELKMILKDYKQ